MVNEQPKLGDPGVTDIPLDGGPEEELGGSPEVKEKPSLGGIRRSEKRGPEKIIF